MSSGVGTVQLCSLTEYYCTLASLVLVRPWLNVAVRESGLRCKCFPPEAQAEWHYTAFPVSWRCKSRDPELQRTRSVDVYPKDGSQAPWMHRDVAAESLDNGGAWLLLEPHANLR